MKLSSRICFLALCSWKCLILRSRGMLWKYTTGLMCQTSLNTHVRFNRYIMQIAWAERHRIYLVVDSWGISSRQSSCHWQTSLCKLQCGVHLDPGESLKPNFYWFMWNKNNPLDCSINILLNACSGLHHKSHVSSRCWKHMYASTNNSSECNWCERQRRQPLGRGHGT